MCSNIFAVDKSMAKRLKRKGEKQPAPDAREAVTGVRQSILALLKQRRGAGVAELADHLHISYEGARLHLVQLEKEGWIVKHLVRPENVSAGRPVARYELTAAGDHVFPKHYDDLSVEIIDGIADRLGPQALKQVLGRLTEKRIREWTPRLEGKTLKERLVALQGVYSDEDPFMSVEIGRDGMRLVERNCPFLNVASRRPALCSVTVCTLQHLLGVKVVREERFQHGHGRCVFRVLPEQKIDARRFRFAWEPAP